MIGVAGLLWSRTARVPISFLFVVPGTKAVWHELAGGAHAHLAMLDLDGLPPVAGVERFATV